MNAETPLVERSASDMQAETAFKDWVHRLVKGTAELQALATGQIDAIMDPATGSAVLLPAARAALVGSKAAKTRRNVALAPAGSANRLLAALPAREYARLLSGCESVKLTYGDVLYEAGEEMRYVYFPIDCLVSLLTVVEGHRALEVGLIGREGMIGSRLALGVATSPVRALVQGTGTALRMKSVRFLKEFRRGPMLQRTLLRFTDAMMIQVSQTAACNRFHLVPARLARWLLMTRERLPSSEFHLTHEFLADMLGVRRAGVTAAASALKRRKLIRYRRGTITILNQQGLEAASCSCYQHVRLMVFAAAA